MPYNPPPLIVRSARSSSILWDFFVQFIGAKREFEGIDQHYNERVIQAAAERGVDREVLHLPPKKLFDLFNLKRLEHLRDRRLRPLRLMAREIFGEDGDLGLMGAYCSHIFHEVSILSREHRSVGRFVRFDDPERYMTLFNEVSGNYPARLGRTRRFFGHAAKRMDELLAQWAEQRVVVRSAFLFGDRLGRRAYGSGRDGLYTRMYPEGGAFRGYFEAARSFAKSGFAKQTEEARNELRRLAKATRAERPLTATEALYFESTEQLTVESPPAEEGAA